MFGLACIAISIEIFYIDTFYKKIKKYSDMQILLHLRPVHAVFSRTGACTSLPKYVHGEMWLALVSVNSEEIAIIISYIIKEEENILQQKQKWKT